MKLLIKPLDTARFFNGFGCMTLKGTASQYAQGRTVRSSFPRHLMLLLLFMIINWPKLLRRNVCVRCSLICWDLNQEVGVSAQPGPHKHGLNSWSAETELHLLHNSSSGINLFLFLKVVRRRKQ